ncbi:hypothetical protein [Bdellovibrio sp. NC01]|nr:hypothetical protein [Bdellovibrio sp. NC01]
MQYKKIEIEPVAQRRVVTGAEIAFKIMLTSMVFTILVTYFVK